MAGAQLTPLTHSRRDRCIDGPQPGTRKGVTDTDRTSADTTPPAAAQDGAATAPSDRQRPDPVALLDRLGDDARLDGPAGRLDRVAAKIAAGPSGAAWRGERLGHALHPLLTDFPLGCWIGAGLLDLVGGRSSRRAAQRLVGLGLLFVPPTALAGWPTTTPFVLRVRAASPPRMPSGTAAWRCCT